MHFKLDSGTLCWILWIAFQVRRPRTLMSRAAVQQQLRALATTILACTCVRIYCYVGPQECVHPRSHGS